MDTRETKLLYEVDGHKQNSCLIAVESDDVWFKFMIFYPSFCVLPGLPFYHITPPSKEEEEKKLCLLSLPLSHNLCGIIIFLSHSKKLNHYFFSSLSDERWAKNIINNDSFYFLLKKKIKKMPST